MKKKLDIAGNFERKLVSILDFFGKVIFYFKKESKKDKIINRDEIKKILVIRSDYFGDVITTLPAIKYLKNEFGSAKIFFLIKDSNKRIVSRLKEIDRIVPFTFPWIARNESKKSLLSIVKLIFKLRKEKFDVILILDEDPRTNCISYLIHSKYRIGYHSKGGGFLLTNRLILNSKNTLVEKNLEAVSKLAKDRKKIKIPRINLMNDKDIMWAKKRTKSISKKKIICLSIGSGRTCKNWGKEKWLDLSEQLLKKDFNLILLGIKNEINIANFLFERLNKKNVLNLVGKTNEIELARIIKISNLVIGGDGGIMHLSSLLEVPTITLFGITSKIFRPSGDKIKNKIICSKMYCSPCGKIKNPPKKCIINTEGNVKCLQQIKVEQVLRSIE